jgi:predicted PurR-regulated permease PerM
MPGRHPGRFVASPRMAEPVPRRADDGPSVRSIVRVVVTVVISFLALYLPYLLPQPIGWIVLAGFITLVAVLFGGNLLGVPGAVLAIPVAATIRVTIEEARAYRAELAALPQPEPGG